MAIVSLQGFYIWDMPMTAAQRRVLCDNAYLQYLYTARDGDILVKDLDIPETETYYILTRDGQVQNVSDHYRCSHES